MDSCNKVIRVDRLTKYYGSEPGIEAVSFTVSPGETVGLLGPNGAGKTTLIRILAGILRPNNGTASIAGHDLWPPNPACRRQIGYLPENTPLYNHMPVEAYLRFAAAVKGVRPSAIRQAVETVLQQCDLEGFSGRLIGKLSKGSRQRVGLAQALVNDPPVLILDEPTNGLDPRQTHAFRQLLNGMHGDRTILLSTHLLPEVRMTCDKVIILNRGRVATQGLPTELTGRGGGHRRFFLQIDGPCQEVEAALKQIPGVARVAATGPRETGIFGYVLESEPDNDPRRRLVARITECGWGLLELKPEPLDLERLFLNILTEDGSDESV